MDVSVKAQSNVTDARLRVLLFFLFLFCHITDELKTRMCTPWWRLLIVDQRSASGILECYNGSAANASAQGASHLYNAMLHPFFKSNMAFSSMIWYQGESNVGAPKSMDGAPYYECVRLQCSILRLCTSAYLNCLPRSLHPILSWGQI